MAADPAYHPEEFQEMLRAHLRRHGLSQMALGNLTGVSQGTINRWLKPYGDPYLVQPTVDTLQRLAPHLHGVTLTDLKRMTNNLSPAEATRAPAPRDQRHAALADELAQNWKDLDDKDRSFIESVVHSVIDMHHNKTRRPRPKSPKTESSDAEDSARVRRLTFAHA